MDFTHEETLRLIGAFKKHPVIYDTNAIGYNDRRRKTQAWKTIAGEINAHVEVCKRKMESLLSSCRREKNKILKSRQSENPEDAYEPKWRYWNDFKFLRGLKDDEEDPMGRVSNDAYEPKVHSEWSTARLLSDKYKKTQNTISSSSSSSSSTTVIKRPPKVNDEYTATGVMVEAKLKRMLKSQEIFARNIINQILYKGLLFQLHVKSEIRDSDFTLDDAGPSSEFKETNIDQNIPKKRRKISESQDSEDSLYHFQNIEET